MDTDFHCHGVTPPSVLDTRVETIVNKICAKRPTLTRYAYKRHPQAECNRFENPTPEFFDLWTFDWLKFQKNSAWMLLSREPHAAGSLN
jgi:hypothetical protein